MAAQLCRGMLLCMLAAACAGRGTDADRARFARDIGPASTRDAYEKSMKVVRQHQFQVERETAPPNLYIETRWRDRAPFDDEQARGIVAAQVRMIVRGTPRTGGAQGDVVNVQVNIENRVQLMGSPDWNTASATPQYRAYAQTITDDLRRELSVGVRRY